MKCLLTKLNGVVNDDSIPKLGFIKLKVNPVDSATTESQKFILKIPSASTITIDGDGYFTDENLLANYGKSLDVEGNIVKTIYVSNGSYYINIPKNVIEFTNNRLNFDIEQLAFSKSIKALDIFNPYATGDISSLKRISTLTYLKVGENITGDVKNLSNNEFSSFYSGKLLKGDISLFNGCNYLVLSNSTMLTGNIETIKNCIYIYIGNNNIVGDASKLSDKTIFVENGKFSWETERDHSFKIIAFNFTTFDNSLDSMLINQSKCLEGTEKRMTVFGNRTSASDAAVQTLQSKGYTVAIYPV